MPVVYKVVLAFFTVGLIMKLFRNKRNWLIGYRTKRSMKSDHHFSLANNLAGNAFIIFSIVYGLLLYVTENYTGYSLIGWPSAFILFPFIILSIIYVETKLSKLDRRGVIRLKHFSNTLSWTKILFLITQYFSHFVSYISCFLRTTNTHETYALRTSDYCFGE